VGYKDRTFTLNGVHPAHRFSGVYEVMGMGYFAAFPIGNRLFINIQTANPRDARWECELAGEAESSGNELGINVEGPDF
jgi:hypothetical protein